MQNQEKKPPKSDKKIRSTEEILAQDLEEIAKMDGKIVKLEGPLKREAKNSSKPPCIPLVIREFKAYGEPEAEDEYQLSAEISLNLNL